MRVVELTKKYVGVPYKLGGKSVEEGLDCFSLILAVGEDLGYDLPYEFEGCTRDTYAELFASSPLAAKRLMIAFLNSAYEKISPRRLRPKDLVLLSNPDTGNIVVGVYSGSNMVLTAPESGVALFELSLYTIKGAYRYAR